MTVRIFSKRSLENELIVDHRDSPGLDKPGQGAGTLFESATITCSRCQKQIILNPDRSRSRGYCRKCDHNVCDRCSLLLKLNHECTFDSCWHIKRIAIEYGKDS